MKLFMTILFIVLLLFSIQGKAEDSTITQDDTAGIEDTIESIPAEETVADNPMDNAQVEETVADNPMDNPQAEETVADNPMDNPQTEETVADNPMDNPQTEVTVMEEAGKFEDTQNINQENPDANPDVQEGSVTENSSKAPAISKPDQGANPEMEKMNSEYEKLDQKKTVLDQEYQSLEVERKKLIEEKDGLKKKEDIQDYNKRAEDLNKKIKQYETRWNQYSDEVQEFNSRVKKDIEKRIEAADQENLKNNYNEFNTQYDESLSTLDTDQYFTIDEEAPLEQQRTVILKYKDEIAKESQSLMKEKEAINKEKKLVKTPEQVEALNKKTAVLDEKIIQHGKKREVFDMELKKFNTQLEKKK